jgi:hypothetical protein
LLERSGKAEQPASAAACGAMADQEGGKQRAVAELLAQKQELLARLQAAKAAAFNAQAPSQAGSAGSPLQPAEHAGSSAARVLLGQPDELSCIMRGMHLSSAGQAKGYQASFQMTPDPPASSNKRAGTALGVLPERGCTMTGPAPDGLTRLVDGLSIPVHPAAMPVLAPGQSGKAGNSIPVLRPAEQSSRSGWQKAPTSRGWGVLRFKRGPSGAAREAVNRMQHVCVAQIDECERAAARACARQ